MAFVRATPRADVLSGVAGDGRCSPRARCELVDHGVGCLSVSASSHNCVIKSALWA